MFHDGIDKRGEMTKMEAKSLEINKKAETTGNYKNARGNVGRKEKRGLAETRFPLMMKR